ARFSSREPGRCSVHGLDAEDLVARHDRGPDEAGLVDELGVGDLQVARGERLGAGVDDLADAGDEGLAALGEVAADDDDGGVDDADEVGDDLADDAAGGAHEAHGVGLAGAGEVDDLGARADLLPHGGEVAGDGPASGGGLGAAEVAAAAGVGVAAGDVADVAGDALGAADELATDDDAGADAHAHLDHDHGGVVGPQGPVLAEGHDVGVLVDGHGRAEALGEDLGDHVAVPAGHDGRADEASGLGLDGAGDA